MSADADAEFDARDCPLPGMQLVEASAGTGKTWTLCALYLRLLLEERLAVEQILVVTFTKAATAELRLRIRARLAEALQRARGQPVPAADGLVDRLLEQARALHGEAGLADRIELALQGFDQAAIHTIHGFCQRALGDLPISTGMPLALEYVEDDADLRLQAAADFWRRRIAGAEPALAAHLVAAGWTPARLAQQLQAHRARPLAAPHWPDELAQPLPPLDGAALAAGFAALCAQWQAERARIVAIVQEALPRLHKGQYTETTLAEACAQWDRLCAQADAAAGLKDLPKLALLSAARLKPTGRQAPPEPHPFFVQAQDWLAARASFDANARLHRLALLRDFLAEAAEALARSKRERRTLGFDDLLLELHRRLAADDGSLARTLRARFPAALVDEFQDTDPLQYAIFAALYRGSGAPAFFVGDPKQAIYRFRHADLHAYLHAAQQAGRRSTLRYNQRATPDLIDALNALFGARADAFLQPGLAYRPVAAGSRPRAPLHDASGAARAPLQLWRLPCGDGGEPLPKRAAERAAAAACAAEIARLLRESLAGRIRLGERALRAGDVAVLVRAHRHAALMRDALAARGIASVEHARTSLFATTDAAELAQVLAAAVEPARAPLLRAALATELMGLDAAALAALDADDAATADWMARFARLREAWLARGIAWTLRAWMHEAGVAARMLARRDGERRLTNLRHLAEVLHEAAHDHAAPETLLRWLQAQCRDPAPDEELQLRLETDRDLVQVVTIHRAKGLEYPVVFCPMLWDGHPGRGESLPEGIAWHDAEGNAVIDYRDLSGGKLDAIKAGLALEQRAERMRLVYVALTRASHRCHLVVGPYAAGKSGSTAEAARAVLNHLVATADMPARGAGWDGCGLEQAWQALAAAQPHAIGWQPLPLQPGTALLPQPPDPQTLAALPARGPHRPSWSIGSYSSLVHGAAPEAAAPDHDLRVAAGDLPADASPVAGDATVDIAAGIANDIATEITADFPADFSAGAAAACTAASIADSIDGATDRATDDATDGDDILAFPRGPAAGECLHALFEQADFTDPAGWPAVVDAVLRRHGAALGADAADAGTRAAWARTLRRLLAQVLQQPLPGACALAQLPWQRRLVELEFHLPARALDAAALGSVLQRHGHPPPRLAQRRLDGYLRGFIDLVFEHDGRFFVLDWKSNHLGHAAADYAPPALERAMAAHDYHLQALLYALALHRHLRLRLPGYAHARHFGGVLYLFVRGMRSGWRDAAGRPCGVHAQRPDEALLDELSALFDGAGCAA